MFNSWGSIGVAFELHLPASFFFYSEVFVSEVRERRRPHYKGVLVGNRRGLWDRERGPVTSLFHLSSLFPFLSLTFLSKLSICPVPARTGSSPSCFWLFSFSAVSLCPILFPQSLAPSQQRDGAAVVSQFRSEFLFPLVSPLGVEAAWCCTRRGRCL